MSNTQTKPVVTVTNGNTAAILGQVSRALKRAGRYDKADEVRKRVLASKSQQEALTIMHEYADLEIDD